MANRYVVSKETLKKIAELPKPEINKDLQEKVKTQIENVKTKTYLVAVRVESGFGTGVSSLITEAESQNEAVRNVARIFLHIDSKYTEEYRRNKVEILSITEIEDVDGFKDTFTQRDFKDEN